MPHDDRAPPSMATPPVQPRGLRAVELLRVLLVEGDRADAESVQNALLQQTEGPSFHVDRANTLQEMLGALAHSAYDAILLDLRLSDSAGLATLATVLTATSTAAVVVLATPEDEVLALKAVKVGAQDYLVKGQVFGTMLARTIRHAIEHKHSDDRARRSAAQITHVFETVADGIVIVDLDGDITFANKAAEELLGVSRSDITSRTYNDPKWRITAVDGTAFPETHLPAARVLATGEAVYGVEHAITSGEGTRRILSINASPLRGASGEMDGVVASVRDVTAGRIAEDQVRFQSTLLEAVGEAVIAIDLERRVTFWNRHAEILFNWQASEVMTEKVFGFVCVPETRKKVAKLMDDVAHGHNWSGEVILRSRNNRLFPAFVTAAPIRAAAGEIIGVVAAITDLTAIKELERNLQHAQRIDAIGRLAGGVAHDFNNILTAVQGYSQLILQEMSPTDRAYADVSEIQRAAERAAVLTSQLLAFSRKQVLQPQAVDVAKVVSGMAMMLRRLIGDGIELTIQTQSDLGRTFADPGQIEQVVLNLVVNARDAMPKGGRIRIELRNVATPDPMVLLQVCDEGTGIAPEAVAHMYEPFFTTKDPGQGTGLGLSTVYGIIGQSGGFIEAANAAEGGAIFSVYLPRVDGRLTAATPVTPRILRGHGQTILVVEEEAAVRSVVVRMLIALDYRVLEANNGGQAVEAANRHEGPIHLVLSDIRALKGTQLRCELKRQRPEIKVVYMSGESNDRVPQNIADGAPILKKPFSIAELANAVNGAQ